MGKIWTGSRISALYVILKPKKWRVFMVTVLRELVINIRSHGNIWGEHSRFRWAVRHSKSCLAWSPKVAVRATWARKEKTQEEVFVEKKRQMNPSVRGNRVLLYTRASAKVKVFQRIHRQFYYVPASYIMYLSDFSGFLLCTRGWERGGKGGWRRGGG